MRQYAGILLLVLTLSLTSSGRAAEPVGGPATRPATAPASDSFEQEAMAILEQLIPAEVRENKREPTDEEKLLRQFMLFTSLGTKTDAESLKSEEENRQKGRAQIAAIERAQEEIRKALADSSPEIKEEAERIFTLNLETAKLFHELTDAPATTQATTREVEERTLAKFKQLRGQVRRLIELQIDRQYHGSRLNILKEIERLSRTAGANTNENDRASAMKRTAALRDLLTAADLRRKAEKQILDLTPPGGYNELMDDE